MLPIGHKSVLLIILPLVPGSPLFLQDSRPLDQTTGQLSPTFPNFQPSPPSLYRVNEVPSAPLHIEAMIDLRNIVEVAERKQMVTLEATFILGRTSATPPTWTTQQATTPS